MDIESIKQKIASGQMSGDELGKLLSKTGGTSKAKGPGFLKSILKGFIEGYTEPMMLRAALEAVLILVIVIGIIILACMDKIEPIITSTLIAFGLGFLFGKIK